MSVDEAMRMGRSLMDQHGLSEWRLELGRGVKIVGETFLHRRLIRISRSHIELNDWDIVRETFLHEIAHAIVRDEYGTEMAPHGIEWQTAARRIGVEQISPIMNDANVPESKYVGTCECGAPHKRDRIAARRKSGYSCTTCGGSVTWRHRATGEEL